MKVSYFFKGVFWTLFIGMAGYIGAGLYERGYNIEQREAMTELVALSMGDLE